MNTRHTTGQLLSLIALATALHTANAQTVRVDFTAEIIRITGIPLLPGAQLGDSIQGRITVDLAQMPEDSDPDKPNAQHNYYTLEAGPFPGYTFEFSSGLQTVSFDSINSANTPGPTPGIFMWDNTGARDWIAFQARSTGSSDTAYLSFEDYTLTNGLITTGYFPEAIQLPGDPDRATFYYGDGTISQELLGRVTTATLTVDTGSRRTSLLQYRIQRSDLPRYKKQNLLNSLHLAEAAFARKRCHLGLKHLAHFQRKLRLLIPRRDADLAYILHRGAAKIIAAGCDESSK